MQFPDIDKFIASMPSEEEIRAKHQAQRDWTSANLIGAADIHWRDPSEGPSRFNIISVEAWIAVAQRASIPFIPLREIARMPMDGYIKAMDQIDQSDMDAFEEKIISELRSGEMVRCDNKATGEVKSALSDGEPMNNGLLYSEHYGRQILPIHDEAFYTTMLDLGVPDIVAFARPIVEAKSIDGEWNGKSGKWPAEFRVYVENNKVVGVSNYYPQVGMDPKVFTKPAAQAVYHAKCIANTLEELQLGVGNHANCPDVEQSQDSRPSWMPSTWGPQDYTLDFICTPDDELLFLEGGPAGMLAADPCCFNQEGRGWTPEFLHGAVFSLTGDIQPLSSLPNPD